MKPLPLEAREAMKYCIPTILDHGNLVHYAVFKDHRGFCPTPSGVEARAELLRGYKQGKGSIQFPYTRELPVEVTRKIVELRIQESQYRRA